MSKRIYLTLLLFFSINSLFSQQTFASLDVIIDRCSLDSTLFYIKSQELLALDSDQKFIVKLNYASYYRRINDFDSSFFFLDIAAGLANTDKRKGIIEQRKGLAYSSLYNYTKARSHYKLALNYFSDTLNKAATCFSLYGVYEKLGQPDSAWNYLIMAKKLYNKSVVSNRNYGTVLNSIGIKYLNEAKYDSAYFYLLASLEVYEEHSDIYNLARTKDVIGTLFYYQSNFPKAIKYYKESYFILEELKDTEGQGSSFSNIGSAYKEMGDSDSAMYYFNQVYQLSVNNNFTSLMSVALSNMATIEAERGHLKSAIKKQRTSIDIDYENNDLEGVAIGFYNLGDFYIAMEKKDLAIQNYQSSLELALSINRVNLIKEIYLKLSGVYEGPRDDLALLYYKIYISLKDSINDIEVKKSIEELNLKYLTKERELENTELKADLEKKDNLLLINNQKIELEKTRRRIIYVVLILLVCILVFVVYSYRERGRRLKNEVELANALLEKKELERKSILERLTLNQESIKQKNNVIKKFEKYLNSPEASENLLKNLSTDKDWAKFIIDFELLYPSYFNSLPLKEGESLTKNDYRISALSHLKLSNKEIAEILNITLSGVKVAKNRLNSKIKTSL